ncbi:sigma 54-interacting transcriptional regulator [Thalassoglobus sp. JC818]|uniref:sigma 54-interacting transcriptional regulator n=1 Tax=Thalassoglobus sp. JC818 TaxID=3232136 RepID=UPI00345B01DF
MSHRPSTLGELKESGYQPVSVKTEMRRNLVRRLQEGQELFPGILGYDETVIPQVVNGILAKHDMLFLGLRGQGKTRMLRMLNQFLDEAIPVVEGSEIHDDPIDPLSKYSRDLIQERGDDTPVVWVGREDRYLEKLATPDVTIADLIGEVDLIKHAEGRHLSSEDVMHFGLIPRAHRGIFCMNELPDLSPKIQVGLFNVLEERDIQIRGFTVRLPLDICMVFSANPEDYTNRGRIVTPLKDRIGTVVRTHYPLERELGIQILEEEAWTQRDGQPVFVPHFIKEIVEETSRLARTSPHVNQASGVSVRMSISNFETVVSHAEQRALRNGDSSAVARVSDLYWMAASSRGKIELGLSEDTGDEDILILRLIEEAVKNVFDQSLTPKRFSNVVEFFNSGNQVKFDPDHSAEEFLNELGQVRGFLDQIRQITSELVPEIPSQEMNSRAEAAVAELILDGLYAHNRLNRRLKFGQFVYGD